MQSLTAKELIDLVNTDPDWIGKNATRENPVEVHGYCDFDNSDIRSLSPFITLFLTEEDSGLPCISLKGCKTLKELAGTFHGLVDASESWIESIHPQIVVFPDEDGNAARITHCPKLKIARGTFHGAVRFSYSAVEEINGLIITAPNNQGTAASFAGCAYLLIATGTYPGWASFANSGVREIIDLMVTAPNKYRRAATFENCEHLTIASGEFWGSARFDYSGVVSIHNLQLHYVKPKKTSHNDPSTFRGCKKLRSATEEILNHVCVEFDAGIRESLRLRGRAVKEMKQTPITI